MLASRGPRVSRELFLAAVGGAFVSVEPWVMDRIAAIVEEEDVDEGQCVFPAGGVPDHFYFLREGRIRCVRLGEPDETILGPAALGMLDAFAEHPHTHAAYALMPLELVRIPVDGWLELLEDSFELTRTSILRLTRTVAALEEEAWASGRTSPSPIPIGCPAPGTALDIVERVAILMRALPARGASVQPMSDLAAMCDEVTFEEGASVIDEHSPPDRVVVLVSGHVEAARGEPSIVWRGGPGEVVLGVGAFGARAPEWRARAVTAVRALVFSVDDWFDVLEENFEMVRGVLAFLAIRQDRLRKERP